MFLHGCSDHQDFFPFRRPRDRTRMEWIFSSARIFSLCYTLDMLLLGYASISSCFPVFGYVSSICDDLNIEIIFVSQNGLWRLQQGLSEDSR